MKVESLDKSLIINRLYSGSRSGAHVHTTKELTADLPSFQRLKIKRKECRKTAIALSGLQEVNNYSSAIWKHKRNVSNCSLHGVFRQISEHQNHKIGQALCKSKVCPICQSVLSHKRRKRALEFFDINAEQLKGYHYQHLVLTVKHDKQTRNYLYASDIIKYFRDLRGHQSRHYKDDWAAHVFGGSYSVEITEGKNGTPHIHIHCLLITHEAIDHRHDFFKRLKDRWFSITGDSTNLRIETVYYKDENGKRVDYDPATGDLEGLKKGFAECIKYTMKTNELTFKKLGRAFMEDLLSTRVRLYSRFGALYNHKNNDSGLKEIERLATDYKDLELIESTENELFDIETGEQVKLEDTRIVVSAFKNVKAEKVEDVTVYSFINTHLVRHFKYDEVRTAAVDLSGTINSTYNKLNDI